MSKEKAEKTNVMRLLEQAGIHFQSHTYVGTGAVSGTEVASVLGENPDMTFKTLVTQGKPKQYYVFMIPVAHELDLKKAALAVGEKSISMLPQKDLLPLTGYVHGGCSPIGMKKQFRTVIHVSASELPTFMFSAGKIGYQTPAILSRRIVPCYRQFALLQRLHWPREFLLPI